MAPGTFFVLSRWMAESLDIPCRNAVAGTASVAKFAVVGFIMALGAGKFTIEKRVVHSGYVGGSTAVLAVAIQAVLFGCMKPYLGFQAGAVAEIVALQTRLLGDSPPGNMAGFTVGNGLVRTA